MGELYFDKEKKLYYLVSGEDSLIVTEQQFEELKKGQHMLFSHLKNN
ncbi:MAG: hypothetical protein ABH950_02765 [Candidatus Altiarchaeota archaeon]